MSRRTVSLFFISFITLIGLVPILFMIGATLFNEEGFSLLGYAQLFHNPSLWHSFTNSLLLAVSVALASTFIGTLLAILLSKTTLFGRMVWITILLIPLLIPPYVMAYGWYMLLGREGVLGHLLFGFWGTGFILFCIYLPIPILIIAFYLRQNNPRLEEAGLLLSSWYSVLMHITLPLLRPAILLSFLIVFILSIGESSVANFLRYDIFPMESFIQFSAFYDFKTATIYTMPLLLIVGIVLLLEYFLVSRKRLTFKAHTHVHMIPVKSFHTPLLFTLIIFILVTIALPLFGMIQSTNLATFIDTSMTTLPIVARSILYASMGATLLVIFGLFSAYIINYKTTKLSHLFHAMLLFFFVLSSIVIGIAFIWFWNTPYTNIIYTTPLIILFGYLIKYLLLSTKIIEIKFSQIPSTLLESAKLMGASWFQVLYTILIPMAKETVVVAWMVGFIFSLRESTLTMLVAPAGLSTLPTYILTQMANGKESTIAALCLMMILITLLPLLALLHYMKKANR